MSRTLAAATAVAITAAAGCGSGGADAGMTDDFTSLEALADRAKAGGHVEQYETLRDDIVTEAEYRAAVDREIACLDGAGAEIRGEPRVDPLDQLQLTDYYSVWDDEERGSEQVEDCYDANLAYVSAGYLATHEARMVEPIRESTAECLDNLGVQLAGDEKNEEDFFAAAGEEHADEASECIGSALEGYVGDDGGG